MADAPPNFMVYAKDGTPVAVQINIAPRLSDDKKSFVFCTIATAKKTTVDANGIITIINTPIPLIIPDIALAANGNPAATPPVAADALMAQVAPSLQTIIQGIVTNKMGQ